MVIGTNLISDSFNRNITAWASDEVNVISQAEVTRSWSRAKQRCGEDGASEAISNYYIITVLWSSLADNIKDMNQSAKSNTC